MGRMRLMVVALAALAALPARADFEITHGLTTQKVAFYAVDAGGAPLTGLAGFTVYRSRNGGTSTAYNNPTVVEQDAVNVPGIYWLTVDEDTSLDSGFDAQEMTLYITKTGMQPVALKGTIRRPKGTLGRTLDINATGGGSIDWAQIDNPGSAAPLSGTQINHCQTVVSWEGGGNFDSSFAAIPTASQNADAVHDEVLSGHATPGTGGKALSDAAADALAAKTRVLLALPNVAASGLGGLPTVDTNNGVRLSVGTGIGQVTVSSGVVSSSMDATNRGLIVDDIWNEQLSGFAVPGSAGDTLGDARTEIATLYAKRPAGDRNVAGAGDTATNLDEIEVDVTIDPNTIINVEVDPAPIADAVWEEAYGDHNGASDVTFGRRVNKLWGELDPAAIDPVIRESSDIGTNTAGGMSFVAYMGGFNPDPQIQDIVQGEEKQITIAVQAVGAFADPTPSLITVVLRDEDDNAVIIANADITRVCQDSQFQIIRFDIPAADSATLSPGFLKVEVRFDNEKVQINKQLRVIEGL